MITTIARVRDNFFLLEHREGELLQDIAHDVKIKIDSLDWKNPVSYTEVTFYTTLDRKTHHLARFRSVTRGTLSSKAQGSV